MQAKASSSFQDHLGWDFTSVWGWRDSGEVKGNQICQTHSKTSLIAASNKSSLSFSVYEAVHAAGMHFLLQWQQKGSALIKALPSAHVELVLKVSDETEVRHPATLSYGPSSPLIWEASHPSLSPLSHFILQYLAVFLSSKSQQPLSMSLNTGWDVFELWIKKQHMVTKLPQQHIKLKVFWLAELFLLC